MEKPDRRPVSLAGLGLISAGAVLGLTLATPAPADPAPKPPAQSQSASSTEQDPS